MRYRVERLAQVCGVTVDTIRYYQAQGLLPPPRREGRIAWYTPEHRERIARIKALRRKGLTLAAIRRVLSGAIGRGDEDLAVAIAEAQRQGPGTDLITVEQLAERSGVPVGLLQAVDAEGIRLGRVVEGRVMYTATDAELVRLCVRLLEHGLPFTDLLALAKEHHAATVALAERAVSMFDEHVRTPIRESSSSQAEAAEALVAAFRELLPAAVALVAHHFRRVLLAIAQEHIERVGDEAEVAATRDEARRAVWA